MSRWGLFNLHSQYIRGMETDDRFRSAHQSMIAYMDLLADLDPFGRYRLCIPDRHFHEVLPWLETIWKPVLSRQHTHLDPSNSHILQPGSLQHFLQICQMLIQFAFAYTDALHVRPRTLGM